MITKLPTFIFVRGRTPAGPKPCEGWSPRASLVLFVAMLALSAGAAAPTISILRQGSNAIVKFTGRLQCSADVEGPYANVIAASPHIWSLSNAPQQFWRASGPAPGTIAAGRNFTVALKADGSLWAWGRNNAGQLGTGANYDFTNAPAQVNSGAQWTSAACGDGNTLGIQVDGSLWAWGATYESTTNVPGRLGDVADWIGIASGATHSAALKADGTLWTWGENSSGQLGNGTYNWSNAPARVGVEHWRAVACGSWQSASFHYSGRTVALKNDGTLWAWGDHGYDDSGTGTVVGTNQPTRIGADTNWAAVACGRSHTVVLKSDGSLLGRQHQRRAGNWNVHRHKPTGSHWFRY